MTANRERLVDYVQVICPQDWKLLELAQYGTIECILEYIVMIRPFDKYLIDIASNLKYDTI